MRSLKSPFHGSSTLSAKGENPNTIAAGQTIFSDSERILDCFSPIGSKRQDYPAASRRSVMTDTFEGDAVGYSALNLASNWTRPVQIEGLQSRDRA